MRTKEEQAARRAKRCRHFNGIMNEVCEDSRIYPKDVETCWGGGDCPGYAAFTADEIAEQLRQQERTVYLLQKGLTSCCEAPFNTDAVITTGPHKNHGPRFCSKCGKLAFMV